MSRLVQLTVAGNVAEADELQSVLTSAGIDSELESAVEEHPREHGDTDTPVKVLVPESELDAARDAIEALTEPDELIDEL
ncbi:MAG TPA: hypothetical protein VH572_10865 [Gaiella sp.]|jgi:hypothetical protein